MQDSLEVGTLWARSDDRCFRDLPSVSTDNAFDSQEIHPHLRVHWCHYCDGHNHKDAEVLQDKMVASVGSG